MTGDRRYGPGLAARHLVQGIWAPRRATREALETRLGEPGRLLLFYLAIGPIYLSDPTMRALGPDVATFVAEESTAYVLGLGTIAIVLVLLAMALLYWIMAALLAVGSGGEARTRAGFATMRSVVVLATWFSLLPAVAATLALAVVLPHDLVFAERLNPITLIVIAISIPYLAGCLAEAFFLGAGRALAISAAVNLLLLAAIEGGSYLLDASSTSD